MRAPLPFLVVAAVAWARAASAGEAREGDGGPEGIPAEPHHHYAATLYGYSVPDEPDFLMLIAPTDVGWLHLEGRYNYEDLHTGSLFAGVTGRAARRVRVDATAMLGVAFGQVHGLAPAARIALAWWKLDLFTEAEYLFDLGDRTASFFYSWSELGLSPLRWLRLAIVGQRTRVIHDSLELQRGVSAGVTLRETVTLTAYELNFGWISPTYIAALGVAL